MNFEEIEKRLKYKFKDKTLLVRALTLASADGVNNNQTLEFFGDAIIEFLVSERIYSESATEGQLTERRKALVADGALEPVSRKIGLDKYLIKGKGDNNNIKAVPSAYEAVVAAIYLDGGIGAAKKFVNRTLDFSDSKTPENYKGELQEYLQGIGRPLPDYDTFEIGTPQSPRQQSNLKLGRRTFTGVAVRARDAEQEAARKALEYLKSSK